ncbi:21249_t:CDS:2, partial [Racocetra persica]
MPERYLKNTLTLPNANDCDPAKIEKFIRYGVEKILSKFPATYDSRYYDVFVGYGGIAFMFFHLYRLFPDLIIAGDNEDSNKLLYGRAGYLYALIFIRKYCKDNEEIMSRIGNDKLKEIIKLIIKDGRDGAKRITDLMTINDKVTRPALMWSWHNSEYVGAIHGVEIIISLLKIYSLYPNYTSSKNILLNAISKIDLVWKREILKKGVTGLCHNTLALGLYGGEWEVETHKGEVRVPDHPWSLFEGLGGGVVYWSDL